MPRENLPEREIHIWWTRTDHASNPAVAEPWLALLSDSERQRRERFVFEEGRREFLAAHALLRSVLSRFAPVEPAAWRFVTGPYGKPSIAAPAQFADLRFNLSHSHGLAVVAAARGLEIGVDVENVTRRSGGDDLAGRFFAPFEVAQLKRIDPASRKAAFFDFWTLKESYIKARGMGLSIPLESFAFELSPSRPPAIHFYEGCGDPAPGWQFCQFTPLPEYRIALAAPIPPDHPLRVQCGEFIP